jgi:hypothetical protein
MENEGHLAILPGAGASARQTISEPRPYNQVQIHMFSANSSAMSIPP